MAVASGPVRPAGVDSHPEPAGNVPPRAEPSPDERVETAPSDLSPAAVSGRDRTRLSILYESDIDLFITRSVERQSGEVRRQFPYEREIERIRYLVETLAARRARRLDIRV